MAMKMKQREADEHVCPAEHVGGSTADARIIHIGSRMGVVGALLAMVGNLLHPAIPSGDPRAVANAIATSEQWVAVHLVIVFGLILMLGGLAAIARSLELEGASHKRWRGWDWLRPSPASPWD